LRPELSRYNPSAAAAEKLQKPPAWQVSAPASTAFEQAKFFHECLGILSLCLCALGK
jgi:hypothetical protein